MYRIVINIIGLASVLLTFRWIKTGAFDEGKGRFNMETGQHNLSWWKVAVFLTAFATTTLYMVYIFVFFINIIGIEAQYPAFFTPTEDEGNLTFLFVFAVPSFLLWDHLAKNNKPSK